MNTANTMNTAVPPMAVGRYFSASGERVPLPYSTVELERQRRFALRVISTFHFHPGVNIMFTALMDEGAHFLGVERAIMSYGMVVASADSSLYDANRVESIARRFPLAAIFGVTPGTLDGLKHFGHSAEKVFAGMPVWARPGAYEALRALPGTQVFRVMEIGPALGLECAKGVGVHVDRFEWDVDSEDGEIVLSSRLERSESFERLRTGVKGHVVHGTCACGNPDPRVIVD
jgi:hypothetical protein